MRILLLAILSVVGLLGAELRVADVLVRAGTVAQLRVVISEPVSAVTGGFTVDLDAGLFGDVLDVQVFSAAGDAIGTTTIRGRHVEVRFRADSGGVGAVAGVPVATIAVPVLAGAASGVVSVGLSDVVWTNRWEPRVDVVGRTGTARAGARVVVSNTAPGSGIVGAGTVVRVEGAGFRADSVLEVDGVAVDAVAYVSPEVMTFTVGGETELTGKTVRVDGVEYVAAMRCRRGEGTAPIFPLRMVTGAYSVNTASEGTLDVAVANPYGEAVELEVERSGFVDGVRQREKVRVGAGEIYVAPGWRPYYRVSSTKAVRVVHLAVGRADVMGVFPVGWIGSEVRLSALPRLLTVSPGSVLLQSLVGPGEVRTSLGVMPVFGGMEGLDFGFSVKAGSWLEVERSGYELRLTARTAGLAAGRYAGMISVLTAEPGAVAVDVPVVLEVNPLPLVKVEGPAYLITGANSGDAAFSQTLYLSASAAAEVRVFSNADWLRVPEGVVRAPGEVLYAVDPRAVPAGKHLGVITVAGPGNSVRVAVEFEVAERRLEWSPSVPLRYSFEARKGRRVHSTAGVGPWQGPMSVRSSAGAWLQAYQEGPGVIGVDVFPEGLAVGTHRAMVQACLGGDWSRAIEMPVEVTIWEGETPAIELDATDVRMDGRGRMAFGKGLAVRSGELALAVSATAEFAAEACRFSGSPVGLTPTYVMLTCEGPPGEYVGTVTVQVGSRSERLPLRVRIGPPYELSDGGPPMVVMVVGQVRPGETLSLYGLALRESITVDGETATLVGIHDYRRDIVVPDWADGRLRIGVGRTEVVVPVAKRLAKR